MSAGGMGVVILISTCLAVVVVVVVAVGVAVVVVVFEQAVKAGIDANMISEITSANKTANFFNVCLILLVIYCLL